MGAPLVCPECHTPNGLLAFECKKCGEDIVLPGNPARPEPWQPGQMFRAAPSAAWETDNIPNLWRETRASEREFVPIDAHDFLGYCLVLRAMQERFDHEDRQRWFDEAIFFLRGGYEFFAHLNVTSRLTCRARIFGGLRHGGRPEERYRNWFRRLVEVARQHGQREVDIFIAEEITSGTGVNRMMKIIEEEAEKIAETSVHDLVVRFRFFVASTAITKFDPDLYSKQLTKKGRRTYSHRRLRIENSFRWFRGPLLGYDEEDINGLRVVSKSNQERELYQSIKYTANVCVMTCPTTGEHVHLSLPGTNDIPNYIGVTILEMVGTLRNSPVYGLMGNTISRVRCIECQRLFGRLRAPGEPWPSQEI